MSCNNAYSAPRSPCIPAISRISRSKPRAALLLPLALVACALRPHEPAGGATATVSTITTGGSGLPSTTSDTTTSGPTTGGFIPLPDGGGGGKECDQWLENCPEGQKCMPYSGDGGSSWNSLKCVDIVPDPDTVGEPCMVFGSPTSGEDTCDKHAMCWDVDPDTHGGACVAMCTGTPGKASCEQAMTMCRMFEQPVLTLCLPTCDPLAQDCRDGEVCVPKYADSFTCLLDIGGDEGQVFDPCEFVNACDPGLLCLGSALASECDPMALGCCLPFCDLAQPGTCPGQDQECLAWFEEGLAPPGHEDVGACALPPP